MCDKVITAEALGESPALPSASWMNTRRISSSWKRSVFTQGFRIGGFVLVLPVLEILAGSFGARRLPLPGEPLMSRRWQRGGAAWPQTGLQPLEKGNRE